MTAAAAKTAARVENSLPLHDLSTCFSSSACLCAFLYFACLDIAPSFLPASTLLGSFVFSTLVILTGSLIYIRKINGTMYLEE